MPTSHGPVDTPNYAEMVSATLRFVVGNLFLPHHPKATRPEPTRSIVEGSGTGLTPPPLPGVLTKLSLPPFAKPCTWIPTRSVPLCNSSSTFWKTPPAWRLNRIPRVSPGFTPFGCTGGLESAEKPSVVTKAGEAVFPPGRLPGDAPCEKATPEPPVMDAMLSRIRGLWSSKYTSVIDEARGACVAERKQSLASIPSCCNIRKKLCFPSRRIGRVIVQIRRLHASFPGRVPGTYRAWGLVWVRMLASPRRSQSSQRLPSVLLRYPAPGLCPRVLRGPGRV